MVFQMILTSSFQVMSRYIYFTSLLHICRALTQKNPLGFQQNQKTSVDQKLTPQKSHAAFPSLSKFGCTLFTELQLYVAEIHGHYHDSSDWFEDPKKSLLKSSHPKKTTHQISYPKKSQNWKFQMSKNPLIIPVIWDLEYPSWACHLEAPSSSPALATCWICSW